MNFLSPLSFFIFIPLAGIVILLYLLKLKRKDFVVSSVLLWQDAAADIQANAPFQKLKKSLLLLLQLLALFALVFAFARPYVRSKNITDNRIVVIIDASASMKSTDVKPSRIEVSKQRAMQLVDRLGHGDSMLVISAASKTRVVASFTSDKNALKTAINSIKPTDTGCNMKQAISLGLSLITGKAASAPRLVVFSDGGVSPINDIPSKKIKLDFMKIGQQCENIAITAMDSRKNMTGEQQVFVGLKNYGKQTKAFNLELYLDGQLLDVRDEKLSAGQTKQEIIADNNGLGSVITAKLDLEDDLLSDNTASVFLSRQKKIKALLVSKGNIFLQNAFNLDSRVDLTKSDTVPSNLNYDFIVFDRVQPPKKLPPAGYLFIGVNSPQAPAVFGELEKSPQIIDFKANNPITSYIDFSAVKILQSQILVPKEWAEGLVESSKGSLIVTGSRPGYRFVQLGFDVMESDFPLKVGFPIFCANCIDWLATSSNSQGGYTVRAGQPIYIDTPSGLDKLTIINPNGDKESITVNKAQAIFDDTSQVGIYKVSGKNFERSFACNLSSSEESDTTPKDSIRIGEQNVASSGKSVTTNQELYSYFILLVLSILTFEWYAYHKRL